MLLHKPETGDDEGECNKASVGAYFDEGVPYLTECFAFAGVLCALVEEPDGQERKEGHCCREVVERDEAFVAKCLAQRLNDGFTREGSDVDHGIEDGEAFGTCFRSCFLGYCSGDNALNERTTTDDECHDGDDAIAQIAFEQTSELRCFAIFCQSGSLEPSGVDG